MGDREPFACLKTRGFYTEDTYMTQPERIEKLLFILAIAVSWAYKIGELQSRRVAIKLKKPGRKAISYGTRFNPSRLV